MKLPLQITSRNVSLSDSAEQSIREKAAKLDQFYDQIMSCRVLVESPHRHQQRGNHYNVRLDITVPGSEIVIKREENEDLYVAIRDAFDAAQRKVKEHSAKLKDVKGAAGIPLVDQAPEIDMDQAS